MAIINKIELSGTPAFSKSVVLLNGEYCVNYLISCTVLINGFFDDETKIEDEASLYAGIAFLINTVDSNEYGDSITQQIGSRADVKNDDEYDQIWSKVSELSKELLTKKISLTDEKELIKKHLKKSLAAL